MKKNNNDRFCDSLGKSSKGIICVIIFALLFPFNIFSADRHLPVKRPDTSTRQQETTDSIIPETQSKPITIEELDSIFSISAKPVTAEADSALLANDSIPASLLLETKADEFDEWQERVFEFNPDPTRAVWLSALFPGLGQIYNRRYWKLPIIVGGYLGLGYATSWNNRMLDDYTRAYRDIMDSDPSTKSYMDFFPKSIKEEDLDKTWLTNTLKSRKNFYRRNRDLCIICMVGVYLLAMVDAYVDASLSHFDISPDLSMQVAPALIPDSRYKLPSVGLQWALCF